MTKIFYPSSEKLSFTGQYLRDVLAKQREGEKVAAGD